MNTESLVMVLGIRPDIIRASIIIRELRNHLGSKFKLAWSGQHYSDNLKDTFFRELEVAPPEIELGISGNSDATLVATMIDSLSKSLSKENPKAVIFLGDTNTVTGTIAAAQLNIPVVHIEGCMRSYDWRMPEEKYRTIADHLSDLIYAYLPEYKNQGIAEGIPEENIVVTGNPIVDVLQEYYLSGRLRSDKNSIENLITTKYRITGNKFFVMTCHRRENVENYESLRNILNLVGMAPYPVIFAAGYRTQRMINQFKLSIPANVILVDPIGYLELLDLLTSSIGVFTDSGTIVEEAAVLGIPSIQMRASTERPQVYACGASLKFDPTTSIPSNLIFEKLLEMQNRSWVQPFGDGRASYRIVDDLLSRYRDVGFAGHQPEKFRPFSLSSFRSEED